MGLSFLASSMASCFEVHFFWGGFSAWVVLFPELLPVLSPCLWPLTEREVLIGSEVVCFILFYEGMCLPYPFSGGHFCPCGKVLFFLSAFG